MASEGSSKKRWLPLESNPEVLTKYARALGAPENVYFAEVLSIEDWALDMVPQPVYCVLFLFPIKDASEKFAEDEAKSVEEKGQVVSPKLWYTKQTIGNACGTVGVLHAVASLEGKRKLVPGCWFEKFFEKTKTMSPEERAELLEADTEIETAHSAAEQAGETQSAEDVNTHFIAFVECEGHLYEMDGRKKFPINHGPTTEATVLQDALKVVKGFMERDPGEIRFTMMAVTGSPPMD
uniref:Ubiquitin carboxyl-terminal hydrolase n=1 Tax=Chromera velia CCMP2878 TaxID=1169474 RepID=A0A0G4HGH7_9ALVE|eukprot:Cvel_6725.t1-p1 / transcript=Cvel_6725.t1 / gene=Cvel_6725 / organism=Chromera_velia_CCMP2878 / gene_product=Ubiquitin carboxyl-terminal hydrolase isozyme L3, putative / transcript_product=Ubiquitin carboxyl-terminal hydrolase isozyme L3, putative / location=Cvel_scaffold336:32567-37083(-) / protein_length=236 / sequence_SO=supercontig / SO=protein_coding / is_pseudo=false